MSMSPSPYPAVPSIQVPPTANQVRGAEQRAMAAFVIGVLANLVVPVVVAAWRIGAGGGDLETLLFDVPFWLLFLSGFLILAGLTAAVLALTSLGTLRRAGSRRARLATAGSWLGWIAVAGPILAWVAFTVFAGVLLTVFMTS
jgi:hypothetical protein